LATGLVRAGIGVGDRVGIWAPNRWEWVIVQYATAEIGAILVTINPAYRARELDYALTQSGVAMVIAARRFKTTDYVALLDEVAPRCPALSDVVFLDSDRWPPRRPTQPRCRTSRRGWTETIRSTSNTPPVQRDTRRRPP
jgi:fatty-acyl-CoA synthase